MWTSRVTVALDTYQLNEYISQYYFGPDGDPEAFHTWTKDLMLPGARVLT